MHLRKAFTMAEAILVMVILGIIATIMISTLRPVEFRDRGFAVLAKKVLGQVDAATTQIIFNNTQDSRMDRMYPPGSNSAYKSFGADMANTRALYNTYLVGTRETPTSDFCNFSAVPMKLKDGSCLGFHEGSTAPSTHTWIPGETTSHARVTSEIGYISIDVNDGEEPNVFGKDRYMIPIGTYGLAY